MTMTLHKTHISFDNKVSKSKTTINGKTYEKHMAYFPNLLYDYLGKPEHIYLKYDKVSQLVYIGLENDSECVEKRLYEVGSNTTTYNYIIPKRWIGDMSPQSVTYMFNFNTHEITAMFHSE